MSLMFMYCDFLLRLTLITAHGFEPIQELQSDKVDLQQAGKTCQKTHTKFSETHGKRKSRVYP